MCHRAFCSWCLLAAAATFDVLLLSLPEAQEAWRSLRQQGARQALVRTLKHAAGQA